MDMLHVRSESDIFTVEKMSYPPERIGPYEITGAGILARQLGYLNEAGRAFIARIQNRRVFLR
jgi:hypothetical protein